MERYLQSPHKRERVGERERARETAREREREREREIKGEKAPDKVKSNWSPRIRSDKQINKAKNTGARVRAF